MSEPVAPAISVVIPTADRADLVMRAVSSVLTGAGDDVEVVVVDDASTDDTVARLKGLADARLEIVELPERSGANVARNTGAAASHAPLIAFLDSDDAFAAGRCARLVELFRARPEVDAVLDDFTVWTGGKSESARQPKGTWTGDRLTALLVAHALPLTNSALAIRRSAFEAVGGFDVAFRRQQDRDLLLRLAGDHQVALGTGQDVAKHQIVRSMSRSNDGYIAALDLLVGRHPAFLAPDVRDLLGYLIARGIVKSLAQRDIAAAGREWRVLKHAGNLPMGGVAALMRYGAGRRHRRTVRRDVMAGEGG